MLVISGINDNIYLNMSSHILNSLFLSFMKHLLKGVKWGRTKIVKIRFEVKICSYIGPVQIR